MQCPTQTSAFGKFNMVSGGPYAIYQVVDFN